MQLRGTAELSAWIPSDNWIQIQLAGRKRQKIFDQTLTRFCEPRGLRVRELVQRGNTVEAELLVHLAEVDARQLYLEEGCSSMFAWCQRVLHFAEGVAYKPIQAARAVRRHPELLGAVRGR
jgi:hypothetical protein